ncbi:Importin alpha subunit (Karyopherin alpha subunit) (Serine-rich RNA polymerase I suppressor protein) [Tulasnella sp. 408]|nr:Importin alpha subunit (Karyopherin alpha subunit) (Serine-rich RNA polymerase I suppressor protein) [Tulasnella sp. 408]
MTEDTVMEDGENRLEQAESAKEEKIDESVLDGYMTDDKRIAPEIVQTLRSNDRNAQLEATTKLRQLADQRENAGIQSIIDSDLLKTITEMICTDDTELQVQVVRLVTLVTSGSSEQTSALVEGGVIPKLTGLTSSTNSDDILNDVFLALGNIGADSQHLRTKLVEEGGLKPLLDVLANPSTYPSKTLNRAANALSCYTHGYEGKMPADEVQDETAESLQDSLHSLHHIVVDEASADKARETNLIPRLVHLCTSSENGTRQHANRCAGKIIDFSKDGAQDLINAGILDVFKTCIVSEDGQDRVDACHNAGNLITESLSHALALIEAGLVPLLVKVLLDQGDDSGARNKAAWTLSDLIIWGQENYEILDHVLEANCLEAFCSALILKEYDAVEQLLKGILVLVKTQWDGRQRAVRRVKDGEGIKQLCAVRSRNDIRGTQLHSMAQNILKKYFPESSLPEDLTDESQIALDIVEGLRSNDRSARLEAATELRELADDREAVGIQQIYDSGLFQTIIELLASDDVELVEQVLELVVAITIGTTEQAFALAFGGVVPKLVGLASSTKSDDLRDSALIALGNIGGDSQPLRDRVFREGGLKPPLDVLACPSKYPESTIHWAAHAIRNYTDPAGGRVPRYDVTAQMIPVLSKYVLSEQDEMAESLEASLMSLCRILVDKASVDKAREAEVIPRLVHLCTIEVGATQHNALQCVNQIIIYSADRANDLINAGILDALKACIVSENAQVRKNACFAASNMAGAASNHAMALILSGFVPIFVKVVTDKEEDSKIRIDAAWALSNLARKWAKDVSDIQDALLEANCIEALCSALDLEGDDHVEVFLEAILVFLQMPRGEQQRAVERVKTVGGIKQLRAIRSRKDIHGTTLQILAQNILTNYFPEFSRPERV